MNSHCETADITCRCANIYDESAPQYVTEGVRLAEIYANRASS